MELKKNPDKDLNNYRWPFVFIGAIITLSWAILVFQWTFAEAKVDDLQAKGVEDDEIEDVIVTEILPPPPPKVKVLIIEEIQDDEEPEQELPPPEEPDETTETAPIVQEVAEEEEVEQVFLIVEDPAEPKGGMNAFRQYVAKYCSNNYPERAKRAQVSGTVFLTWVIDKNGNPTEITLQKGIGAGCDEVAMEAVKSFGAWSPPKQRGKPVKQRFSFPVRFKLGK